MRSKCLIAVFAMVLMSGCVRINNVGKHMPSMGEQIMDLTEAYENGSITEQEFRELRQEVFRSLMQ